MQHKRFQFIAIILLGFGLAGLQAQTMYVKQSNGTQTAYTLSNVQKMTFSSGNVTIQKTDNSTGVYTLSGLRYLSFNDYTTGIKKQIHMGNTNIVTYPNPVNNVLNIDLTGSDNKNGTINILSLEGKVMHKQVTTGSGIVTLNLSELPQGIYLCRYANATETRTVKIIKQ